jgi:hypothetical protein
MVAAARTVMNSRRLMRSLHNPASDEAKIMVCLFLLLDALCSAMLHRPIWRGATFDMSRGAFVKFGNAETARHQWRAVANRLRERFPKLAELMDVAEHDVLAHMAFAMGHWHQPPLTNLLKRLNGEIKRRTDVAAIFPNERASVWAARGSWSRTTSGPSGGATCR